MSQPVKLTEIYTTSYGTPRHYKLRSVYVNPEHVICLREDEQMMTMLREGKLIEGLDARQSFTQISVSPTHMGQDITVIGTLDEIYSKLNLNRQLLKG